MARDKPKLSGYDLTLKLKKARNKYPLSATEQALYYELINICNESDWDETFTVPNDKIMVNLRISENTLNKARLMLIDAGLIFYKSGKSKRQYGYYSFIYEFLPDPTTVTSTANFEVDDEVKVEVNDEVDVEDYNKQQLKHELKLISETIVSVANDLNFDDDIQKNENFIMEIKSEKTPYWKPIVEIWFNFYVEQFERKPTFDKTAGNSLKSLLKKLKTTSKEYGQEWTEEYACKIFLHFLKKAYQDNWRSQNFMLHILNSHYDSIINTNGKQKSPNNGKGQQPVSGVSAFNKFNQLNQTPGSN